MTITRPISKVEDNTGEERICLLCHRSIRITGRTVFYAPRRNGEGGLAVPEIRFVQHGCPADRYESVGAVSMAAIRAKAAAK